MDGGQTNLYTFMSAILLFLVEATTDNEKIMKNIWPGVRLAACAPALAPKCSCRHNHHQHNHHIHDDAA